MFQYFFIGMSTIAFYLFSMRMQTAPGAPRLVGSRRGHVQGETSCVRQLSSPIERTAIMATTACVAVLDACAMFAL